MGNSGGFHDAWTHRAFCRGLLAAGEHSVSVTMLQGDLMGNQDMSQEFLMLKRTGVGVVMDRDYGAYKFSNV